MQEPPAKTPEELLEELQKEAAIRIGKTEGLKPEGEEQKEVNFKPELPGKDVPPEDDADSFKMKPGWEMAFGSAEKKNKDD